MLTEIYEYIAMGSYKERLQITISLLLIFMKRVNIFFSHIILVRDHIYEWQYYIILYNSS